jgi:hypothetical protein
MTLEEMLAREAIRYTISRYNSAVDRAAYHEFDEVFMPDGVMIFGERKRLEGLDTIIATMTANAEARGAFDPDYFQRHLLGTPMINMIDAENARAVTYIVAFSDLGLDHTGVYLDRFVKSGERWLIAERVGHLEWGNPETRHRTAPPKPASREALDLKFRSGD